MLVVPYGLDFYTYNSFTIAGDNVQFAALVCVIAGDDLVAFGDRFRIFKKPKMITLETKDGFKQKVKLENIRGMQYPNIQAMETSELKVYLDEVYEGENEDFAISEIRLLGMELP